MQNANYAELDPQNQIRWVWNKANLTTGHQLAKHCSDYKSIACNFRKPLTVDVDDSQYTCIPQKQLPWITELKLDHSDREILLSPTGWLNGNIINAAQDLLKKQFSSLHGLQDVNLGLVVNFKVSQHEFVQILHSSPDHWVAISTIGVEESNVVLLFDSMILLLIQ